VLFMGRVVDPVWQGWLSGLEVSVENPPEMTSSALVELLSVLDGAGIDAWLDGGWGVDALLGTQTRPHKDVDLIVRLADVPWLRDLLGQRGFAIREGSPPSCFVLADGKGLEVDVHPVTFDAGGNGVYRMEDGQDWIYPSGGFCGQGVVAGASVHCLSPEAQVLCHAQGYTPAAKDRRDMEHLRVRFGVELPPHLREKP
jgi:lincosamide nucleotidyltransferase A/C/D/E